MTVHITTGNRLDVVYDYIKGKKVLLGLKVWGSKEVIPLPDPKGLAKVMADVAKEFGDDKKER